MKKTKSHPDPAPLRVLILEDNPVDAELMKRQLRKAGINFVARLVEGKREFGKALSDFLPQVILSDFKLPRFDGLAALQMANQQAPDVPFIFVSGSIGEEKAIELLAQGASDYILKDNLARLSPAVKRALEETRLKLEKKEADQELQRHVDELRLLAEAADHFVQINDLDELYDYLSSVISKISAADYLLLSLYDEKLQAVRPKNITGFEPFRETLRRRFNIDPLQMAFFLKDMRPDDFRDFVSRRLLPVRDGLNGLANRQIARPSCRLIEKFLKIDSMHTMGFSWENQLFGGLTVFYKKGNALKNGAQIEALVNLASVAIKRLLAEKLLRTNEERFRHISDTTSDIAYSCHAGKDGVYSLSWIAGATERTSGYTIEELMALGCWGKLVLPDDLADYEKHVISLAPGKGGICELHLRRKDGVVVWVQSFAQAFADPEAAGQRVLYGGLTDISERKRIENALRESEKKYRTLVTQSPDGIFVVALNGKFLSVNHAMCSGLQYDEAELLSLTIQDIVPEKYMELHRQRLAEILKGTPQNEAAEYEVKAKNGEIHHISILSAPFYRDNELIGFQGVARDITEKRKMEIRLRESEEYYRTLVETSPDAIVIVDAGGRVTFASQRTFEIFAIPPQTVITGISVLDFVEPGERDKVQERMAEIRSGRSHPGITVYRLLRHDRRPFWGEVTSSPLRDAAGRSVALLLVCRDVSERKRAEELVSYQAGLLQDVSDAIIATDKDNNIQMWNKAAEKIYGWKTEEAVGKNFHDFIKPEYRYTNREEVLEKLKGEGTWSGEIIHHLRGGEQIPMQSTITMLNDATGNSSGTVSVNHDISERKRAEELIGASLKEKEVLLQEIHHRVKNNLQIVSGLLTLQADHAEGKSLAEMFQGSQDRIRTIALVHEKLYRSHNLAEIAFDEYLRSLAEDLVKFPGKSAGRVTIRFEMESVLFSIEKAVPLGLIVNELVTNALKHAFPDGRMGEIHIGLRFSRKARFVGVKTESGTLYKASQCELTVADNGIGLPAGFDPAAQKSLGMKLVSMLAMQLRAEIKVKSGPGTEFRLVFPGQLASENRNETS